MNEGASFSNGRHPHKKLTARSVAALSESGRYADGGGLYLLVAPSGSKSWVLRTVVHGKRCDIGLGGVGLVTLAEAREHAHALRKSARAGGDPLALRRDQRRTVPTLAEAAAQVHGSLSSGFRNDKHRKQWIRSLTDVLKSAGGKRVDVVSSSDLMAALMPNWLKKPETSRRVLQRLRVIFDWCKAQGFRAGDNPTDGLSKVLPKHRETRDHHAALPYQRLPAFVNELRTSEAGEIVKLAFEFLILCASRTSEVLLAQWSEIDTDAKCWAIPASRMKSGVEHRVPLSPRCLKLLEVSRGLSDGGSFIFPGRQPKKPLSNMVFLMTLRRIGHPGLTAHGFRSTFRDWAAEKTNQPRAVCEAALAHALKDKTEAAYNRTDLFERRRELMGAWARFATSKPADVVVLRA
jgi:integrase